MQGIEVSIDSNESCVTAGLVVWEIEYLRCTYLDIAIGVRLTLLLLTR
jgi:hypothetical protein